jgi:hypothetical protein
VQAPPPPSSPGYPFHPPDTVTRFLSPQDNHQPTNQTNQPASSFLRMKNEEEGKVNNNQDVKSYLTLPYSCIVTSHLILPVLSCPAPPTLPICRCVSVYLSSSIPYHSILRTLPLPTTHE